MDRNDARVNFEAPAGLYKWPSLKNERSTDGTAPYLVTDAQAFVPNPRGSTATTGERRLVWKDRR